ncbi:MAG: NAAT family transporter [Methylacidiphilales bacterium]|nr:NAAT family transporter [Candidatus Methylacidiphilales bacterium]
MEIITAFVAALTVLFPLLNPVGNTPIFFGITAGDTPEFRRHQALKTAINVFIILTVCLLLGRYILAMFGLSVPILRLAGGLVVANVGWGLLQQSPQLDDEANNEARDKVDVSLSPMALPIIANPGAMSIAISLGAGSPKIETVLGNLLALASLTILNYVCLILGEPMVKKLGRNGMDAFNKVLGFLVLGIGVNLIVSGIHDLIRNPGM